MSDHTQDAPSNGHASVPAFSPQISVHAARSFASPSHRARNVVATALDLLRPHLATFVEARMRKEYGDDWVEYALGALHTSYGMNRLRPEHFLGDLAALLHTVGRFWPIAFRQGLSRFARPYIDEVREVRNAVAHGDLLTLDDAFRAVDTVHRLLRVFGVRDRSRTGQLRASLLRSCASRPASDQGLDRPKPFATDQTLTAAP